ncbi:nucleoside diphosphate-linked moiety X motif 17 isoform X2 [Rissa tridactyla]|uniref:nucleoside diphosphate-linked moiety X motif 17 isoform X2 n=1 Tax=Rissa tridactyla TaxID=75485 RepID=UPI0023BA9D92|nr:nucleoside diphosphate-linked moiety X motif 17 isoform X2 [Rissa tridactyla]
MVATAVASAVVAITLPWQWPSWCHRRGHHASTVAIVMASTVPWLWPAQRAVQRHGSGHAMAVATMVAWQWSSWCHGGGPCGAMIVAITVPWQWQPWCHGSGHHGARVVALVVPRQWPRWLPSSWLRQQPSWWPSKGHRSAHHRAMAVATMVPAWWPLWCHGSGHGGCHRGGYGSSHGGSHHGGRVVPWRWPRPASAALSVPPTERHRHLLPSAGGRGRGELRAGPRPLPPLGRGLPRLHPRPPQGGHVEPGEELLDVGLRELEEETGLRLEAGTFSWRMLGLWEVTALPGGALSTPGGTPAVPSCTRAPLSPQSIYPPMLSRGLPRRHHIVTYLLLLCQEPHQGLDARMRPSESEVSAYAWLEPPVLEAIAATEDGAETLSNVPSELPATVSITEVSGGSSSTTQLPTATLLNTAPAEGEDVERVSTGTKFALRLCLESLRERGQVQPSGGVTPLP